MSGQRSGPPRWARAILSRALPPGSGRATILGDLHQEHARVRPRALSGVWYAAVALGLAASCTITRARAQLTRPRHPAAAATRGLEGLAIDLRQAARALRQAPAYTIAAVLTLALGIGAATTVFCVIFGALLRPQPFPANDRLLRIGDRWGTSSATSISSMSVPNYLDLAADARLFDGFAAFTWQRFAVTAPDGPTRVMGMRVSSSFFPVLGAPLQLGRAFTSADAEPGAPATVIVSDAFWRRELDGRPGVVGERLTIDLVPHVVVGVAPRGLWFPGAPEMWTPLAWDAQARAARKRRSIEGLARLRPGVAAADGLAELNALFASLEAAFPEANRGVSVTGMRLDEWMVFRNRRLLWLFGGAVGLLLLVACANVAGLALARGEVRRREMAVRAALGAGRGRLARLMIVESLLVSGAAGWLGALTALWGVGVTVARFQAVIPRAGTIGVDAWTLVFAAALSVAAGVILGFAAASRPGLRALAPALAEGGRGAAGAGRRRARRLVVVLQVAIAVVLVTGAILLGLSVRHLAAVDLGVDARGVVTFAVDAPTARYPSSESTAGFFDRLLEDVRALPGVRAAGGTTRRPLAGGTNSEIAAADDPQRLVRTEVREVTPGYFAAAGVPLVEGRAFEPADRHAPVVLVNRALARTLFPNGRALGRGIVAPGSPDAVRIVGVVADVREFGPESPAPPAAYWPYGGGALFASAPRYLSVAVRADGDAAGTVAGVRSRLAALDPDVPLFDLATLDELEARTIGESRRSATTIVVLFAATALALGAIGIYGVVASIVQGRTRELGVRLALGATSGQVRRLVLGQGLRLAAAGVALGLAGALALGRLLTSLLYGVTARDPAPLAAAAVVLFAATVAAADGPARRAAAMDPCETLRRE